MKKKIITLDTTIGQLLEMDPRIGKLLKDKFNLHCLGCGGAEHETIELGAMAHGLDPEELLKEIKSFL